MLNSTFPFTKACAYAALRSVMKADIPNCHGFTEVVDVRAPLGSLLRPVSPGPTGARGITGYRMIDCLFGALAQAVPDRVAADSSGGSTVPTISGVRDGKIYIFCETAMGTWGAGRDTDGQEGVQVVGDADPVEGEFIKQRDQATADLPGISAVEYRRVLPEDFNQHEFTACTPGNHLSTGL